MAETLNTAASSEEVAVEKVATATVKTKAAAKAKAPTTAKAPVKEKAVKVKFLLSPTGKFGLGYNVDEEASLTELQADELIEAGYAKLVK